MLQFSYPYFLWALLVIPLMWLVFNARMRWKRRAIERLGDKHLIARMMPDYSPGKLRIRFFLLSAAWLFLVIGLANPRIGSKYEEVKRQGVDLVI
ncbi:MAG: BatA domain-containing protein, partial [Bacteroidetes bacterium]|nr:BatA domain-containing protein [Bacteroidota bacterium]